MKKKIDFSTAILIIVSCIVVTCILTFAVTSIGYEYQKQKSKLNFLYEIDELYRRYYIGEIDEDEFKQWLISGYIAGVGDKYAYYLTAEEYAAMMMSYQGEGEGIGVRVTYDENENVFDIYMVMPDSPAEKAGIQAGDKIIKADGVSVDDVAYYEFISLVKGEIGTNVEITVKRGDEELVFVVTRDTYAEITVDCHMYTGESAKKVGVIRIIEFNPSTVEQFKTAVQTLIAQGANALVFDLRNNPGGELQSIVDILDYLLPEGPVVRITDGKGNILETYTSDENCVDLPMSVITNSSTASAAELFVAALKDYNKATSVGTPTFGKGTIQGLYVLRDGSVIAISSYLYSPPYSDNYEGIGVLPNVLVEIPAGTNIYKLTDENDIQLHAAVSELNK